ncbi:PREDICTED: hydroxylysine kinase [Ceratosolen solmsi marchali]|uniref:Hydroxylysine kinase n=1 Tax=Ceratosolen solmsi marchali TaxID=326594 RepID=A0AAJ6YF38_9HYME|nr:PREDICTED: hydroxylysine kinase [Ceratosolen solmsi marchali]
MSPANNTILDQLIKPNVNEEYAKYLVEQRYGLKVKSISKLNAYDDRNYHVLCENRFHSSNPYIAMIAKDGYVLKIINSLDSRNTDFIEAQNELLLFLDKMGFICPVPVRQKDGSYYSMEMFDKEGPIHALRVLVFRQGVILNNVYASVELLKQIGLYVARLDRTMEKFSHPAYENQTSIWILSAVPKLRDFLFVLDDKKDVNLIEKIIVDFETKVLSIIKNLDEGIVHGDLNDDNIIVNADGNNIEAIIDFGDSHKSCFIFELAICLCYIIIWTNDIDLVKHVIEGYRIVRQLAQQEREILKLCICARFAQSLVLGIYSCQREPNNKYLIRSHKAKWLLLKKLWAMDDLEVMNIWSINN